MAVPTGLRVFTLVFTALGCAMPQQRAVGAAQTGSAGRPSASAAVKRTSTGAGKPAPEAAKQSPSEEESNTFPLRNQCSRKRGNTAKTLGITTNILDHDTGSL